MDHSKMSIEEINSMIKLFYKLLKNEDGKMDEKAKSYLVQEIRLANLEILLNRD